VNTTPTDGCIEGLFPVDPTPFVGAGIVMFGTISSNAFLGEVSETASVYSYPNPTLPGGNVRYRGGVVRPTVGASPVALFLVGTVGTNVYVHRMPSIDQGVTAPVQVAGPLAGADANVIDKDIVVDGNGLLWLWYCQPNAPFSQFVYRIVESPTLTFTPVLDYSFTGFSGRQGGRILASGSEVMVLARNAVNDFQFHYRDSAGTWTNPAFPAGVPSDSSYTLGDSFCNVIGTDMYFGYMAEKTGVLNRTFYVIKRAAGSGTLTLAASYDLTTLYSSLPGLSGTHNLFYSERGNSGDFDTGGGISASVVVNDAIYFVGALKYQLAPAGPVLKRPILAKWDGTTLTPVFHDFVPNDALVLNSVIGRLLLHDGVAYMTFVVNPGDDATRLYYCESLDMTTWAFGLQTVADFAPWQLAFIE
jgi:hypothetical protein